MPIILERIKLHETLVKILGSRNVYFQPPESIKLLYPCIIYKRSTGDTQFANDKPYTFKVRYQITYIDKNPDSEVLEKISDLPMCTFDRHFTADNLNHDIFNIYF